MNELHGRELVDALHRAADLLNKSGNPGPRWAYTLDWVLHRPESDGRPRRRRVNGRLLPLADRAGASGRKRRGGWRVVGRNPFA